MMLLNWEKRCQQFLNWHRQQFNLLSPLKIFYTMHILWLWHRTKYTLSIFKVYSHSLSLDTTFRHKMGRQYWGAQPLSFVAVVDILDIVSWRLCLATTDDTRNRDTAAISCIAEKKYTDGPGYRVRITKLNTEVSTKYKTTNIVSFDFLSSWLHRRLTSKMPREKVINMKLIASGRARNIRRVRGLSIQQSSDK